MSYLPILDLNEGGEALRAGKILLYPTETYYALGCRYDFPSAISKIQAIKQRPNNKPLSLLAASMNQVGLVADASKINQNIITHFWPGPLTILLPSKPELDPRLKNYQNKTAIRISDHPFARRLALLARGPLVATSANLAGAAPISNERDFQPDFLKICAELDCAIILNTFYLGHDRPSTIIEPEDDKIKILRDGAIPGETFKGLYGAARAQK